MRLSQGSAGELVMIAPSSIHITDHTPIALRQTMTAAPTTVTATARPDGRLRRRCRPASASCEPGSSLATSASSPWGGRAEPGRGRSHSEAEPVGWALTRRGAKVVLSVEHTVEHRELVVAVGSGDIDVG